jgi:Mrp family chromosome partitioning ATPase
MGRVLEALQRDRPCTSTPKAVAPDPSSDGGAVVSPEPEPATEIPFIEVGGPHGAVEASPGIFTDQADSAPVPAQRPNGKPTPAPAPRAPTGPAPRRDGAHGVAYRPVRPAPAPGSEASAFAPQIITYYQPHHPASRQYRTVLGELTPRRWGKGAPILLLAAPTSGVGATTVLLNLAVAQAAQGGRRVVAVDANLRRPAVADRLGLSRGPGLSEVVAHAMPLAEALRETVQPGLWALTAGDAAAADCPWPSAQTLRTVLQELRTYFDWVWVDGPAWDGGPEVVGLVPDCDAVYIVLAPDGLNSAAVRDLAALIPPLGGRLGGYLLTQR